MGLIDLIGGCKEANHRNPTNGYESMCSMAHRILMLVKGFTKSDAVIGEYPVTVLILLPFATSNGLEKG